MSLAGPQTEQLRAAPTPLPAFVRSGPPPLHGNLLTLLRFARANHMLSIGYLRLVLRWLWLKLRWGDRLVTDGMCFVCPGVKFEIGRDARVVLGRWSWLGHGCKVRVHEGSLRSAPRRCSARSARSPPSSRSRSAASASSPTA